MAELIPCAGCARHVRVADGACPFCGERVRGRPMTRRVARGATRAAIFYVGATLAGAGCDDAGGGTIYGGPPEPPETIAQPYGAPPDPPPEPPLEPPPEPPPETIAQPPQEPEPDDATSNLGMVVQPYGAAPLPTSPAPRGPRTPEE